MYKNQLQELAQRSCFNLPAYSCIREGPDHAPRFKATVNFNGETFESPNYCANLRQAEHAAAEVALSTLSKRGPSQSLAAKILDETGVCKNLLQETAQRAGVSLPVYTTIRRGPGHLPVFKCIVEVAGRAFAGEPAKTKKQAEKNAAMAAWSTIKQLRQPPLIMDSEETASEEFDRSSNSGALTPYRRDDRTQNTSQMLAAYQRSYGGRPRVRMVNVRERNRLSREGSPAGQFHHRGSSASSPSGERSYEAGRFLFSQQSGSGRSGDPLRSVATHQRSHSLSGVDSSMLSQQEALAASRATANGGGYLGRVMPRQHQHQHQQQRLSRLSLQSCSDRFELRRPLMEELQLLQREEDDDWLSGLDSTTTHLQQQQLQQQQSGSILERANPGLQHRRALFQSQSERFELKPSLLDELYQRDEEDWWLRGEVMQPVAMLERERSVMYGDRGKSSYTFYDGNRGSYSNTENMSHAAGYNNDHGSIGSSYSSGYRDASNTSYGGYSEGVTQKGSYTGYSDGPKLPSSYANFNDASQKGSYGGSIYDGDGGSSYGVFTVDAPKGSFYNDVGQGAFSGYPSTSSSSTNNDDEVGASSSTSIWSRPAQWWMSHLPSSPASAAVAVAQSLGLRPVSSMAPPVRVRQMVAVCSSPPPRHTAVDTVATTNANANTHALHHRPPPPPDLSSSIGAETTTCQLFDRLRL